MRTRAQSGHHAFTLTEVIIVVGLIAMLSAIAIPSYLKARNASQKSGCIANLKTIDSAVQTWAFEHSQPVSAAYAFSDSTLLGYLKGGLLPNCPADGVYSAGDTVSEVPVCSLAASGHTL